METDEQGLFKDYSASWEWDFDEEDWQVTALESRKEW